MEANEHRPDLHFRRKSTHNFNSSALESNRCMMALAGFFGELLKTLYRVTEMRTFGSGIDV